VQRGQLLYAARVYLRRSCERQGSGKRYRRAWLAKSIKPAVNRAFAGFAFKTPSAPAGCSHLRRAAAIGDATALSFWRRWFLAAASTVRRDANRGDGSSAGTMVQATLSLYQNLGRRCADW